MLRPPNISWNPQARRYAFRNEAGGYSFMSEAAVRGVIDNDIDVAGARMGRIGTTLKDAAQSYKDGKIDQAAYLRAVRDWRDGIAAQQKGAYIGQAATACGGVGNMTQSDHGRCGGLLRVQYRYTENTAKEFADNPDLVLGLVAGRPGAEERGQMFADSSRFCYERTKDIVDGEAGLIWCINILEAAAHHCRVKAGQEPWMSCPGQTALGPVRYTDPRRRCTGARICKFKCQCGSMRFRTKKAAMAAMVAG